MEVIKLAENIKSISIAYDHILNLRRFVAKAYNLYINSKISGAIASLQNFMTSKLENCLSFFIAERSITTERFQ